MSKRKQNKTFMFNKVLSANNFMFITINFKHSNELLCALHLVNIRATTHFVYV